MKYLNIEIEIDTPNDESEREILTVVVHPAFSKCATSAYYAIENQLELIFDVESIQEYEISETCEGRLLFGIEWQSVLNAVRLETPLKRSPRKYATVKR